MSVNDPTKWYTFVTRVQESLNSSVTRSTKMTPFELMFGTMHTKNDFEMNEVISNEQINEFSQDRIEARHKAKANILKI